MTPTPTGGEHDPQFLTFHLHDGTYGIGIEFISEIRAIGTLTALPGSPNYLRGIMNLRGSIVPVVDLRARLGLPPAANHSRFAVTIITRHENKSVGLIADGVNEVIAIPKSNWQNSKAMEHADQRFVKGLALLPDSTGTSSMIVLLNLDRLYDPAISSAGTLAHGGPTLDSITALHEMVSQETSVIEANPKPTQTPATEITA